jgi:argininosuccinate synthase
MTILRLGHLDIEGLVMDGHLRSLRDQFCTRNWSELLYNGYYFSFERAFVENSILFSQKNVAGTVRMLCFKGNAYVLGRASKTSKLYSAEEAR